MAKKPDPKDAERQARQDAAIGVARKPFESDGPYFARAMWHYKAEAERCAGALGEIRATVADERLTDEQRVKLIRVTLLVARGARAAQKAARADQ
jgi:hypothetical protein